uniref:Uncharacterized protein n=1 Tax=Arundo donax TaxID=35708 RepID=A0A0A9GDM8_ARUDO
MKTGVHEWDEDLIKSTIYAYDVAEILGIELSNQVDDDYLAWHYEKSGLFTVRSAYKLALRDMMNNHSQGQGSNNADGSRELWKTIWSAEVPLKIKVFA